jgi:hydroxymethylbilane synthase
VSAAARPLRLGTRASPLALAQAALVAGAIEGPVEIVRITTSGDGGDRSGDKSRWVDRIEDALAAGEIDAAVHSAKDLPAQLADGLEIAGAPCRADARDALCGSAGSLAALRPGARVGTSSLRRAAQLLALREDLEIVMIVGNVDTRLRKLADEEFDAIVLACAGLERLGRSPGVPLDELVPAIGQGTLAIEARAADKRVAQALSALRDEQTERALAAERAVATALGAGCFTPIGAHATTRSDGRLELRAFVGRADGSAWVRDALRGDDPVQLGEQVAARLLSAGAGALLR